MMLNRDKVRERLSKMTFEDLDWIERECRKAKKIAKGIRFYTSEDPVSMREARQQMVSSYHDGIDKHHGGDR